MTAADWYLVTYLCWGVNAAYGLVILTMVVSLRRGGKPAQVREEIATVVPLGTLATLCWFVGYLVIGPWWALLTAPVGLGLVLLCLAVCAYVREQRTEKGGAA